MNVWLLFPYADKLMQHLHEFSYLKICWFELTPWGNILHTITVTQQVNKLSACRGTWCSFPCSHEAAQPTEPNSHSTHHFGHQSKIHTHQVPQVVPINTATSNTAFMSFGLSKNFFFVFFFFFFWCLIKYRGIKMYGRVEVQSHNVQICFVPESIRHSEWPPLNSSRPFATSIQKNGHIYALGLIWTPRF